MRRSFLGAAGAAGILLVALCAPRASAVSTRLFSLDSADALSEGKLEGAAVDSSGVIVPSVGTRRHELPNVAVARSLLVDGETAYVGTGNDGNVWKLVGGSASVHARTGELLVSALARDASGTLYAGTLPEGKIFAIDRAGKVRPLAEPEGAEHVWALVYDPERRTLFAATGPEGKVFAIDAKGKSQVYYDSSAEHVMALARDDDGTLYAGTSDEALVLKLLGPGRAEVVYDFEGNEVTALAVSQGRLAVAANLFPKPATSKKRKATPKKSNAKSEDKTTSKSPADQPKPGKGDVWRVDASGRARKLFASEKGHVTALQWTPQGDIYAATSQEGHVHRIRPDGSHALWIDADERQVLALDLTAKMPTFVTGDAAAIYTLTDRAASRARWISKVLDARFRSRFGQLTWRGRGKVSFQTRSGNTEKPDDSWSEWSSVLTGPGPIRSPAARFLQIRADLDPADSMIYAVQAYYLPRNQPITVKEVTVQPKQAKGNAASKQAPTTLYEIEWKVHNPDGDELRYRLFYRPEGADRWRAILKESEVLRALKHDWQTEAIPDGFYRVRVQASDELDNPEHAVLIADEQSEPFRLDNHQPHIDGLRLQGGKIVGVARDELGPISGLEYAVDGQEWKPFYPRDDLFDTKSEAFELALPALSPGDHVIAVRARDARDNTAVSELEITVK